MGFKLTVTKGKSAGKEFSFTKASVRVGRDHENDLVLYDLNVSRNHFEIVQDDEGFLLRDCGSQNGTRLNEKATLEARLGDGDRIRIGALEFEFSGSDTQPRINMDDRTERAELNPPRGQDQRVKLEEIRTHAVGLQQLQKQLASGRPSVKNRGATVKTPPAARSKPLWRRMLYPSIAGLSLALLAILVLRVVKPNAPDLSERKFALTSEMTTTSYGAGDVDVNTPVKAQFVWISSGGRAFLAYTPGGIDRKGEVTIELNGTTLAELPITPDWGVETKLKLDRKRLRPSAENVIVFRHHAEPGEERRWGVRDLSLQETALPPPSLEEAKEQLRIGDEALDRKRIALANLAIAADAYRRAVLLLEGLEPHPPEYARAEAAMQATELELARTIDAGIFRAEQARKLRKSEEAEAILRELLLYFPRPDDPRRKPIEERMAK